MSKLKDFLILLCSMQVVLSVDEGPFTGMTIFVPEGGVARVLYKFVKKDQRSVKFVLEGEKENIFDIQPDDGSLYTKESVNWQKKRFYTLRAKTLDRSQSVIEGPHIITIRVMDVNDPPAFNQTKYYGEVRENIRPDIPFMKVFAVDIDDPTTGNAQLVYKIKQQIPAIGGVMYFQINNITGEISTTSAGTDNLKFEDKPYELVVEVSDLAENPFSDNTRVYVTIKENLWKAPNPITIQENSTTTYPYIITKVTWNDQGIVYELHQREKILRFPFRIDENGNIYVTVPLDREQQEQYIFYAVARNNNGISLARPLRIEVNVEDINDNPPVCPAGETIFEVQEKEAIGSVIGVLSATDMDQRDTSNSVLGYKIVEQWPTTSVDLFRMYSIGGDIQLSTNGLSIQRDRQYRLKVVVSDEGVPSLSATCWVLINVIDTNDHIPIFERFDYGIVTLPEDTPLKTLVKEIQARDDDEPLTGSSLINYTIVLGDEDKRFKIDTNPDNNRGYVRVAAPLDYEACMEHDLVIEATNPEPLFFGIRYNDSSRTLLKVIVTNVDEKPVFESSIFQKQLPENITIGTFIIKINASDPEGRPIRFSLRGDKYNWLRINEGTGEIYSNAILDRERANHYTVEVIATETEGSKKSSAVFFHLYLDDVNDNYPELAKNYYDDFVFCFPLRQPESVVFSGTDADDPHYGMSLKFILGDSAANDWNIQYVNKTTARLTMKHSNFEKADINVPVTIRDNGYPPLESFISVPVRICTCASNSNKCETSQHIPPDKHATLGMALGILFGTLAVIGTIIAVVFISINKKKKKTKSLGVAVNVGETVNLNL